MTFEQWWENKKYYARFLDGVCKISVNDCGDIARGAWEAAQPKWTLCKDGQHPFPGPLFLIRAPTLQETCL